MFVKHLGVGASLAAASAALVFPESIPDAFGVSNPSPIEISQGPAVPVSDPHNQLIKVPLSFVEDNTEGMVSTQVIDQFLVISLKTQGDNSTEFHFDSLQAFLPPLKNLQALTKLKTHQVPGNVDAVEFLAKPENQEGNDVSKFTVKLDEHPDDVATEVSIFSVDSKKVAPMTIRTEIQKEKQDDGSYKLNMVKVQLMPESAFPKPDDPRMDTPMCRRVPIICKVKIAFAERVARLRAAIHHIAHGCRKKLHAIPIFRPEVSKPTLPDPPKEVEAERPSHQLHQSHKSIHIARVIVHILKSIFVPILIGVAAGMATYLLGWVVGTSIALVYLWVMRRRNGSGYNRVHLDEEDGEDADESYPNEKDLFAAEEIAEVEGEAPPVYQDIAKDEKKDDEN